MTRRDEATHRDAFDRGTGEQLLAADDHVIGGVEANGVAHGAKAQGWDGVMLKGARHSGKT